MSETVDTASSKPQLPASEKKPKKTAPSVKAFLSSLGVFLFEILGPAALAAVAMGVLFSYFNLWALNRILALVIFGLGMVVIGVLSMVVVDTLTAKARKENVKQNATFGSGPRMRLVGFILGGAVLPLVIFLVGLFVPIMRGKTVMDLIATPSLVLPISTPASKLGGLVMNTTDSDARILAIQALQSMHTTAAMDQLVNVVNEKPGLLNDPVTFHTLAEALGSYGTTTKDSLMTMFNQAGATASGAGVDEDRYIRYFEDGFASLKKDVQAGSGSSSIQLDQIDAMETQLKASLQSVNVQSVPSSGDLRQEFVLQAFLDSNLKEDKDILSLARKVANSSSYSTRVRGQALLLVAKLGSSDDVTLFYSLLDTQDAELQSKAMLAISELQAKLAKK
jgi:hypothetical protein